MREKGGKEGTEKRDRLVEVREDVEELEIEYLIVLLTKIKQNWALIYILFKVFQIFSKTKTFKKYHFLLFPL